MAKEYAIIVMDQYMKDNGQRISNMELERKLGLKIKFMKGNIKRVKEKVRENLFGETVPNMTVNSMIIAYKGLVHINGWMEENIQDNG